MIKCSVLSSGSRANCTYVSNGRSQILIDCGLSLRETERRLRLIGVNPEEISAILITHEHRDHVNGVLTFAKKYRVQVFATMGSLIGAKKFWDDRASYRRALKAPEKYFVGEESVSSMFDFRINYLSADDRINWEGFLIEPFSVPHDANEPVGFRITADKTVLVLATDLGTLTPTIKAYLSSADILILESNHDLDLLFEAPYPWVLKERIRSDVGHLSNQVVGKFVRELSNSKSCRVKVLIGVHISENSNVYQLALENLISAWQGQVNELPEICIAGAEKPTKLFTVSEVELLTLAECSIDIVPQSVAVGG
ncbi:MAG: MBL fold metallo-hydrolase [Deltaproteobacteria bacterium]|jgi:phosphoribosyl 1,2-cyclic phosphodiesterase|nr:MBL fold metallo-hydrolase [Deltaproteobacteria bacterium]